MMRFACSLLFLSLGVAIAQESRGTIGGRVADAQDSGIPKAKVAITNVETGVATMLETNDKGAYVAPLLIPGRYRISAEHPGFKRATQAGITLSLNDTLQIDLRLELGEVSQSIDVVASAPLVQSTDASMGAVITTKDLSDYPIAQGNPYAMIALAPGVTFEGDQTLNRPYEPTHIVDYSMSGAVSGTTDITLEGVSNTSKGSNGRVAAGAVPPIAAVGEMRIETSSFDARTGQSSGGLVNISLKSGANKLHGSAEYTKMRPEWFANNFFANRIGAPRGDFHYDRWSASLSGPVAIPKIYDGRNRTFFSWAYEQLTDSRPRGGSANLTVPTPDQRQGDFSELLALGANYQIYDPATRRRETGSTTRFRQEPFPGNIIPSSRFDPVAVKVLPFFALPLTSGTTADHRNNYPQPNLAEDADYLTHYVKVDQNFSSRDRMFIRANGYKRNTHRLDYFQTQATGLRELYRPISGSADLVHAFGAAFLLNLRYGYTRFTRETVPLHGRNFDLTSLGFPKSLNDSITASTREFPVFNINGFFTSLSTGEARFMDTHSFVAAFSKLRGVHSMDFGMEWRAYRQNRYNGSTSRSGSYVFSTTWTRGPLDNSTTAPIGQGMAAFLLGLPETSSLIARNSDFAEQSTVWAGYFQDNWRVRRNLTVNLGVRYEIEGPLTERFNKSIRDLDFSAVLPIEEAARAAYAASYAANPTPELPPDKFRVRGGLVFAGVNGQPRELWQRDKNNIMPRIGLAWTFARNMVFRAGYGIYYSGLGLRRTDVTQNGFERNTNVIPTKDSGLSFSATLSNPFPDGIQKPVGASLGVMTDVGNSVDYFDPHPKAGYNQRWQASIQRQFGKASVVELAYVGNRGTQMEIDRDLNIVGNSLLSRSPVYDVTRVNYLTANVPNPFRGLPGVNGTLGSGANITRENLLKPFPQFGAVTATTYQGYSWYHSLQFAARRRFSKDLSMNASYTWSKNMLANAFLNPADPAPYETVSNQDRKHRIAFAGNYELPFGKGRTLFHNASRPLHAVVGGWQISAIYILQSGLPMGWGDVIFFGTSQDIGKGPKTPQQWFNTAAGFTRDTATRPTAHYRTWPLRFSNLREDAMNNIDLNIRKQWRLNERGAFVELRGESFNAFNRPQMGAVNTDQFSTAFGQITATRNYARQIQAVLRFNF